MMKSTLGVCDKVFVPIVENKYESNVYKIIIKKGKEITDVLKIYNVNNVKFTIEEILLYHKIQSLLARIGPFKYKLVIPISLTFRKPFVINGEKYDKLLLKGFIINILDLEKYCKSVGMATCLCDIKNGKEMKKDVIVTQIRYIAGETLRDFLLSSTYDFDVFWKVSEFLNNYTDFLERMFYKVYNKKIKLFYDIYDEDVNSISPINIKVVDYKEGYLYLVVTDIGASIKELLGVNADSF